MKGRNVAKSPSVSINQSQATRKDMQAMKKKSLDEVGAKIIGTANGCTSF